MSSRALVFLLVTLLNLVCSTAHQDGNLTDNFALLALKSNLHDPKGVLNSWNHSVHFCKWEGVRCGRLHKRVTILNLNSRSLSGFLSPHVGNLSFLKRLDLRENNFEGDIPNEISRLFRLRTLTFSNNSFGGKIPGNLSHCSSLNTLDLQNNRLVGEIPIQLFSLSNLAVLAITGNNITGNIPGSIRNLTSLEILYAGLNLLEGSIPSTLGELRNLKEISLDGNKISGMIPLSIYNLSSLNILALARNELVGTLPQDLGLGFPHIRVLDMWQNSFHGSIPLSIANASKLTNIAFGNNSFSGKLPSFGRLKNLVELDLDQNHLGTKGSEDEMSILIDSLTNCTLLGIFAIDQNNISGTIPNSVGNLSTQIYQLSVGFNRIYGVIPLGLGNLVNLEMLEMQYNQFEGVIPHDIANLQRLYVLSLSTNKLRGRIPSSIGNMSLLSQLFLYKNKLEGVIPSSLGSCKNLLLLEIHHNNLTGIIPKELFNTSSLSMLLDLSNNHLVGPIPPEVGKLKNLEEFRATENKLFGKIPPELGSCSTMVFLYLKGNQFTGSILALKSLTGLQELDLSQNNLSGTVPKFLEKFSLNYLNLSFNDFEGELPMQGAFANASVISIDGNSRLCGGISDLRLPRCKITKSKQRRLSLLHVIIISLGSSILATLILSLLIIWWRKNKRREQSSQSPLKESFSNVSYSDLVKATNGFSSTNIIGMGSFGSVYKGILDQDEMMVAVKVLNLERYGASKSFEAECKVLRNIRHRNLLKIITSCSSIDSKGNDFKALVYEYMSNGSLERWLHSDQETLNLRQRIDIVVDVAYALDYLHHQSGNPIIHCDLKPSNVLLDDDMVAHVGDFGLAKFAILESSDENQSRSVGLKGTIGYAAPEYGLGNEASTSGDIYSYGILLLEMMTGKSPIDPMFGEGLNLHNYAKTSLPDNVIEIVEPNLLHNDEEAVAQVAADNRQTNRGEDSINENIVEDCIVSVLKIGVACSMESPQDRIDVNDIIHQLQSIKRTLGGH